MLAIFFTELEGLSHPLASGDAFPPNFMNELLILNPGHESIDNVVLGGMMKLILPSDETSDVVMQGFALLVQATCKFPR